MEKVKSKKIFLLVFFITFSLLFLFNFILLEFIEKDLINLYNKIGVNFNKMPKIIFLNFSYIFLFVTFLLFLLVDFIFDKKYDALSLSLFLFIIFFICNNLIALKMVLIETNLYIKTQSNFNCFYDDKCWEKIILLKKDYNTCLKTKNNEICHNQFNIKYLEYVKNNNLLLKKGD